MKRESSSSVWERIRDIMSDIDRAAEPAPEERDKVLREKWRRLAVELANPPEEERENLLWEKIIILKVGKERYAFRLDNVEEIMRVPRVTPVPCVPKHFRGVINRRGTVLPVVDLKVFFGGSHGSETTESRVIVLSHGKLNLGLLVEAADSIVGLAPESIQQAPRRGTGIQEEFSEGMITLARKVIVLLDSTRLLQDGRMKVDKGV